METLTQIINAILIHGKADRYELIVNEFSNYIYAFVCSIVGNSEEAQDSTQEVFIKGYFSLKKLKEPKKFKSWISQIAYNESISHLRKKKRGLDITFIDNIKYESAQLPDNSVEEIEIKAKTDSDMEMLRSAIKLLKEEEQYLIKAFYYEDRSVKEIEEVTGLSESNIKTKLHRIKRKLKDYITDK